MSKMVRMVYDVKFGLCCICLALKKSGLGYSTMSYKTFASKNRDDAFKELSKRWIKNSLTLIEILKFCAANKIAHYRMPSDIFPLATHSEVDIDFNSRNATKLPDIENVFCNLNLAGIFARENRIGLSFHPSQFVVLASERAEVRKNSAAEINFNSSIFDAMNVSANSVINVHLNTPMRSCLESDFADGLKMLSPNARSRLRIENEDRGYWNVANLRNFLKTFDIPVTFDFLHHKCNNLGESEVEAFEIAAKSWGNKTPIFHYAESRSDKTPRAHSDYCKALPPFFGLPYVCEIEAKMKDFAILRLMEILGKSEKLK